MGRPPAGATFEVEPVRRQRSRGLLAALAWAGALGSLVGLAIFGRVGDSSSPAAAEVGAASASATAPMASYSAAELSRLVPAPGDAALIGNPIHLESPASASVAVRTSTVRVAGTIAVPVGRVDVALEMRNDRIVRQVTVVLTRASMAGPASFETELDIPGPRPGGTMWVVVTAYDPSGRPLDFDIRPFTVGPITGG